MGARGRSQPMMPPWFPAASTGDATTWRIRDRFPLLRLAEMPDSSSVGGLLRSSHPPLDGAIYVVGMVARAVGAG